MPLVQSSSRKAVGENISREESAGKPRRQAIAIALDVQRRNRAEGGASGDSWVKAQQEAFANEADQFAAMKSGRFYDEGNPMDIASQQYRASRDPIRTMPFNKFVNAAGMWQQPNESFRDYVGRVNAYRERMGKTAFANAQEDAMRALGSPYARGGTVAHASLTNEPIHLGGLVAGHDGGRADTVNCSVPRGSYILPADVISGYGQGNTTRGAKLLDAVFDTPRLIAHPATTQMPMVAVKLSSGEYSVHPSAVAKIGGGNLKKGHDILDKFVVQARAKHVKETKALPGPKGGDE